jgi:RNA polymerase sigma-70 factor (ECF subfamily)
MQVTSDEALIERIAAGDKLAMRALFARHQLRVFRFLCGIVRDRGTAEDVLNEVFIDIWRQAGRFEGRSSVSTWVLAIARFKALSALRRPREAEIDEEAAAQIEDVADDPEVVAQKKDKGEILRSCLDQLSAEHREIIDLVYYQEKSVEDCAKIVAIPENTVKTRLFHARKRLAEIAKSNGLDRGWP